MNKWIQRWAGSYTLISCSYWAKQYPNTLKKVLGKGLNKVLFIHKEGTVSFFIDKEELDSFGDYLAEKTKGNEEEAIKLLENLKQNTDLLIQIMKELEGRILTQEEYQKFLPVFEKHLAYHNFMKKTVDYLDQTTLNKLLPKFKDARIYSETVYSKTELFFRFIAKAIAKKENYDEKSLTCLTQLELEAYIKSGVLPNEEKLKERYCSSAILTQGEKVDLFTGLQVENLEKEFFSIFERKVKGDVAFNRKVQGICRIITDPFKKYEFNQDDILVTGMTRPEFTPYMDKAAGIVTDSGGILCHAAIISREMRIPCIVGTQIATKVFADGDLIEIDGDTGEVKKVER